jgi:hypothetical protein
MGSAQKSFLSLTATCQQMAAHSFFHFFFLFLLAFVSRLNKQGVRQGFPRLPPQSLPILFHLGVADLANAAIDAVATDYLIPTL